MEKIIIISPDNDTPLTFLNLCVNEESMIRLKTPAYLCVLGLVNQILADKANAKSILNVKEVTYTINDEIETLYFVTYLESEMIANKDDLEAGFAQGVFCGR